MKARATSKSISYRDRLGNLHNETMFQIIDAQSASKSKKEKLKIIENPIKSAKIEHIHKMARKIENDLISIRIEKQPNVFSLNLCQNMLLYSEQDVIDLIKRFGFSDVDIEQLDIESLGLFYKKIDPEEPEPKYPRSKAMINRRGAKFEISTNDMYFEIKKREGIFEIDSLDIHESEIWHKEFKQVKKAIHYLLQYGMFKDDINLLGLEDLRD
jgi:hypothetical protein